MTSNEEISLEIERKHSREKVDDSLSPKFTGYKIIPTVFFCIVISKNKLLISAHIRQNVRQYDTSATGQYLDQVLTYIYNKSQNLGVEMLRKERARERLLAQTHRRTRN